MRIIIFYFLFFLIPGILRCQELFNKRVHTGYVETAYSIIVTDSGYVVSAGLNETGQRLKLGCVFIDKEGDFKNVKIYDAYGDIFPGVSNALSNTKDGGFILATAVQRQSEGFSKDYLMRFDSNGDTLWTKTVGDTSVYFAGRQVRELDDGNLIYLILATDVSNTYTRIYLTKLDSYGNQLWFKTYGTGNSHFKGYSLDVCHDKGYIISGYVSATSRRPYVLKVDSMGNVQWQKYFGSSFYSASTDVLQLSNGDFFVTTYGVKSMSGSLELFQSRFVRLNSQGNTVWDKYYGPIGVDNFMGFPIELDDGSIIAGGQEGNHKGYPIGAIFKMSPSGDSLWWRNYYGQPVDSIADNYIRSIKKTSDGGLIAAGFVTGPQDIWIFKIDSMGCEVPLCHVDSTIGINEVAEKEFSFKVYPNPSSGLFNFEYDLKGESEGNLNIYNSLGTMVRQEKLFGPSGKVQIEIDGTSGTMYFYTIEAKGGIIGKGKLVLVK